MYVWASPLRCHNVLKALQRIDLLSVVLFQLTGGDSFVLARLGGKKQNKTCFIACLWCWCAWLWTMQGEKECLNSETTELKQKIRYLQDQLLPLSKQREYQEKEIQRLNRVRVGLTAEETVEGVSHRDSFSAVFNAWPCPSAGSRGSLKLALAFVLATTTWPGQLRRRRK